MNNFIDRKDIKIKKTSDATLIFSIVDQVSNWLANEKNLHHWKNYYTLKIIQDRLSNGWIFFVATTNDKPVGVCAYSTKATDYYDHQYQFTEAIKPIYPGVLGVLPNFQNKGVGTVLLKNIEKQAELINADAIRFDARKDYAELIESYERKGYERIGEVTDPDDGEQYVLFEKLIVKN